MSIGEQFDAVLAAARWGEEWAFVRLFEAYNPGLVRYFGSRAPRQADDLAAETWLGVARGIRDFAGGETGFRSWLYTIAHRRLADFWQQERSRPVEAVDRAAMEAVRAPDDTESLVVDAASARATLERIASALSPDQAEVVLLRLVGGLTVQEVADITGKRVGTVRVLQHRALRRLSREFSVEGVTP